MRRFVPVGADGAIVGVALRAFAPGCASQPDGGSAVPPLAVDVDDGSVSPGGDAEVVRAVHPPITYMQPQTASPPQRVSPPQPRSGEQPRSFAGAQTAEARAAPIPWSVLC